MSQKHHLEDKKIIAKFLKISLRTFDRYIKKFNFTVFRHNNRKKYDINEILKKINSDNLRQVETMLDKFGQFKTKYVKENIGLFEINNTKTDFDNLRQSKTTQDNLLKKTQKYKQKKTQDNSRENDTQNALELFNLSSLTEYKKEAEIYKKLYTESINELKQKQERLEGATYRVGQLETQLKNTVPLLSYRQKEEEVLQLTEDTKKQTLQYQQSLQKLKHKLTQIQLLKNVYIVLLFSFLIFLPVILIYSLSS